MAVRGAIEHVASTKMKARASHGDGELRHLRSGILVPFSEMKEAAFEPARSTDAENSNVQRWGRSSFLPFASASDGRERDLPLTKDIDQILLAQGHSQGIAILMDT